MDNEQSTRFSIGSHIAPLIPGKKYIIPIYQVNEAGDNLEVTDDILHFNFVSGLFPGITMSQLFNVIKHKLIYDYGGYSASEEQQEIIDLVSDLIDMIKEEKRNRDHDKE